MPTGVYLPRGENSTVKTAGLMIELYNHRDSDSIVQGTTTT